MGNPSSQAHPVARAPAEELVLLDSWTDQARRRGSAPRVSDSAFEIVVDLQELEGEAPARPRPASERPWEAETASGVCAVPPVAARVEPGGTSLLPPAQRRFGRYSLIAPIAQGGMGQVFLARFDGLDGFQKLVAIKRIHEHLSHDQDFVRMFVDEARLAARISHPNVVQVLELGRVGSRHFIAMEYVDGASLGRLLQRARPSIPLAAQIVAGVAAGLHAAHELRDHRGAPLQVVHRDVSPQNILLGRDGSVKVLDFGVARARGNLHVSSQRMIMGKPSYLAPEQITGTEVDRRADVFALGIVLFETITHRRLFAGATENETLARIQAQPIPRPSDLVPSIAPPLEQIMLRALARDPADRFQTAQELQLALEAHLVETRTPPLARGLSKLVQSAFLEELAARRALLREVDDGA